MASKRNATSTPPARAALNEIDGLVQLSFLIQNTLARCAAEYRLSLIQTRLLGILRDREPSMNELAKLLDLDKSSITGLIDRAEGRGLVRRVPSMADRRTVLISLTNEARSMVATVATQFECEVSTMLNCFSIEERDALGSLVSQLLVTRATERGVELLSTTDPEAGNASHT